MTRHLRPLAVLLCAAAVAAACSGGDEDAGGGGDGGGTFGDDCLVVDVATSPEKLELLTDLADEFNGSDRAQLGDDCVGIRVQRKSSGAAASLLADGWDEEVEGPRPVLWSPAGSSWASVLDLELEEAGQPAIAGEYTETMLSPLVIAMPRPMAEALGWPDEPLGFGDILALARDGAGWGSQGHPEWGPFRLGKTNPNFSTSGLSALVAQAYAGAGTTSGLSLEDLEDPAVDEFARGVESAVVHYGDTTLTFLNNWYRADQRGNPYSYVSAVAVEEKSVLDYNAGNPDGILAEGEEPRPPRVPLVAIYPEEGTLYSDNPMITLDAEWVDDREAEAAGLFVDFVTEPENQERVLEYGFRPANPDVTVGDPISEGNGVNPEPPQTLLDLPDGAVLTQLLDDWADQRKSARVLLVIDVSGSMGDLGDPETGETKLDLAKTAAAEALEQFNDDDEVGLWVFSTELGDAGDQQVLELVSPTRVGDVREDLANRIRDLVPVNGTPLYEVTQRAYEDAVAGYDPARINAVVLLSDGFNDDGDTSDDRDQLSELLATLEAGSEGQDSRPVRVFPIGYGSDADLPTLRQIADATSAAVYDSSDPQTIDRVFDAVISNF
ncbi:MAG TPA: extracellular solute-binding protein [Acidimicrobiales bacterium]|nr:extracellular solute-binding protein [Acidimicrobiales bacterium]